MTQMRKPCLTVELELSKKNALKQDDGNFQRTRKPFLNFFQNYNLGKFEKSNEPEPKYLIFRPEVDVFKLTEKLSTKNLIYFD